MIMTLWIQTIFCHNLCNSATTLIIDTYHWCGIFLFNRRKKNSTNSASIYVRLCYLLQIAKRNRKGLKNVNCPTFEILILYVSSCSFVGYCTLTVFCVHFHCYNFLELFLKCVEHVNISQFPDLLLHDAFVQLKVQIHHWESMVPGPVAPGARILTV